jgi:hypothetical protein
MVTIIYGLICRTCDGRFERSLEDFPVRANRPFEPETGCYRFVLNQVDGEAARGARVSLEAPSELPLDGAAIYRPSRLLDTAVETAQALLDAFREAFVYRSFLLPPVL